MWGDRESLLSKQLKAAKINKCSHNYRDVEGSYYESEYEPSLAHVQRQCTKCGERYFATTHSRKPLDINLKLVR